MLAFKKNCITILIMLTVISACTKTEIQEEQLISEPEKMGSTALPAAPGTLFFKSGFQGYTTILPYSATRDSITGDDYGYNWTSTLQNISATGLFKDFYFNYESGTNNDRKASIILAPGIDPDVNARVLEFKITNATTCYEESPAYPEGLCKARISGELFAKTGLTEYYQQMRVYLPNWEKLEQSNAPGDYRWFCLFECGNEVTDPNYKTKNTGYKVGLYITKNELGKPGQLRFRARGEKSVGGLGGWQDVWNVYNKTFQIPTNKWMTMEIYLKEGDDSGDDGGRFYVTVKPDGGTKQVVIDTVARTYNVLGPANGIEAFNPMKAYCSDDVVKAFTTRGTSLRVLFDNFEIWKGRRAQ